jgi:CheY-like chemotaxis protein
MNDKILVVEDEENIRTNIKEYLENQNYQVIEAADGEAGLEMVETMKPDLIILDLMLPKVDGMEVCKQVRRNHNTPIIMVTARNEEIDKLLPHKRPSPPAHQIAVLRVASRKRRQIAMARQRLHGNPVLLRAQADKRCHEVD